MFFLAKPRRKQIAIVGNAYIHRDMTKEIDQCDLVLRFNNAIACGNYGGRKTNILCVTNIYPPLVWIVDGELGRIPGINTRKVEVWFPRDSEVHRRHARIIDPNIPEDSYEDQAERLLLSNNFKKAKSTHFSREFNEQIFQLLTARSPRLFMSPSTGIMVIEYVLREPRFAKYNKLAFGFSFQGWEGHAWDTEREIVMEHTRARSDFRLIDTDS